MECRVIEHLQQKGIVQAVDLHLSELLLRGKEPVSSYLFLIILVACSRMGHLCLHVGKEELESSLLILTQEEEELLSLAQIVREGVALLPSKLCSVVTAEGECLTPLCRYREEIYLQKNWLLQQAFLFHIKRLTSTPVDFENKNFEFIDKNKIVLTEEQTRAIEKALTSPVSIITGGPGTGKSFTAIEILSHFLQTLPDNQLQRVQIKLAAPTGKAAALLKKNIIGRLGESLCEKTSGIVCGTLHSFVSESMCSGTLVADLLLVDEASMIDAKLFVKLLSSLRSGGHLILMGDKDQLPPVELGNLFADLVMLAPALSLPCTILRKNLRIETAHLHKLSDSILAGDLKTIRSIEGAYIVSSLSIIDWKERLWKECYPFFHIPLTKNFDVKKMLQEFDRFRILSCMRKGPLGVDNLNREIFLRLVEGTRSDDIFVLPILIMEKSSSLGLVNGDVGIVIATACAHRRGFYNSEEQAYFFSKEKEGEISSISASLLPSFEPSYCLSVHKSQGSEYSTILLLVPPGSERFGKEVLYTGVTRAKKSVLLFAEERALEHMLSKSSRKMSGTASLMLSL